MKLSDVEYQADNSKATFYYSADDRVDFRELIKLLASEFKIRVEMRQISLRQEAGRIGGIGICGRELCCSTWIHDFKSVSTSAARYQNLSLNPSKLSGQCGRLKCCLNYELDTYMLALENVPTVDKPLQTESGPAKLQKTDIFRKLMWFSYNNENNWHSTTCERVKEIQEMNEKGIIPFDLHTNKAKGIDEEVLKSNLELERLDKKFSAKKKKKRKNKNPSGQTEEGSREVKKGESTINQAENSQTKGDNERSRNRKNRQGRKNFDEKIKLTSQSNEESQMVPKKENQEQVKGESENRPKNKGKRRFPPRNRGNQNKGD
jgi:cell fate regulator YaaT (PSP1 superfamily)